MADQTIQLDKYDEETRAILKKSLGVLDKDIDVDKEAKRIIKEDQPHLDNIPKLPSSYQAYVKNLPEDDKDRVLRYLDIFRDDTSVVLPYLDKLQETGKHKEARKVFKLKDLSKKASKESWLRWTDWSLKGDLGYDVTARADLVGKQKATSFYNKKLVKTGKGIEIAFKEAARNTTRTIAAMVDAGLNTDALTYIENNWPEAQQSREGSEKLAEDLTSIGISFYAGKKILKGFGKLAGKVAPNYTRKVVEKLSKQGKPILDKTGKPVLDKFGNVKNTSSVAQKLGYWGIGAGAAYGVGEALTGASPHDHTILGDTFGIEAMELETTKGLSGREKALRTLKNKLKYGADGTALIAGLTVGGRYALMPVLRGTGKVLGKGFRTVDSAVLNPLSKIAASRKSGVPQLFGAIHSGKNKLARKAGIPPMDEWGFFTTTAGPLKERILKAIDAYLLTPIRSRGKATREAKDIMDDANSFVRSKVKRADLIMKELEAKVYNLAGISFGQRVISSTTNVAAKGYMADIVSYLKGTLNLKQLPSTLRPQAKEVRQYIDKLTAELKPFIKSADLHKEFVDNVGKYLRNSYEIFKGNAYRPPKKVIEGATAYFKNLLKKTDPYYKKVAPGSAREKELVKEATSKVDEILQAGRGEGTTAGERAISLAAMVKTPIGNLIKKKSIPVEIQKLLGKVDDPRSIVIDTVQQQANLLAHLRMHRRLVDEGLKNNWIFKSQKDFIQRGFQAEAAPALVPIRVSKNPMNVDLTDVYTYRTGKGVSRANYLTTKEMAQAINGDTLITDYLLEIPFYKSFLAAKTSSQLTKTVLSLMTQMRNVETAAFFSFINGHMGKNASVVDAFKIAFQDVTGKGGVNPQIMRKKLEEYLKYGVFDNSVVAAEVEAVMKDIVKGQFKNTESLLKYLMTNPVFRKATEFYQAADNLWKAYGYEFTKSQLIPAIPVRGIQVSDAIKQGFKVPAGKKGSYSWQELVEQQYKEVFGKTWSRIGLNGKEKSYAEAMREIAARYTRDVYPNYSMVPKLVRNWRRLPYGNFIAFQSELIRNIYNVLKYSTREMAASNPYLRQMGARRFLGMSTVLYGFDKGLQVTASALTNLDEDFIRGYQRFFSPFYVKGDIIIPISRWDPVTKTFKVLDWSKEQPFASVTDAFRVAGEAIFSPLKSDEDYFNRFFKALIYDPDEDKYGGLVKMFEPFIEPSILMEAIKDVLPLKADGRGGETREGVTIYDPANDTGGEIMAKIFSHLIQTMNPTTFKNAGEILASYDGEVSKAGDKYDTKEKLIKLFLGLGIRTEHPETAMRFIVGDFGDRLQKTASDFRRNTYDVNELYRNPTRIIELFEEYQKNRYREMSRINDFMKVAEQMFSKTDIYRQFKDRQGFGKKTMRYIFAGRFKPANLPSWKEDTAILRKNLEALNKAYPNANIKFTDIFPAQQLQQIKNKWDGTPLSLSDKEVEEYHRKKTLPRDLKKQSSLPIEEETETVRIASLPVAEGGGGSGRGEPLPKGPPLPVTPMPRNISQVNTALINPTSGLTRTQEALLSPTEKAIASKRGQGIMRLV